MRDVKDSKNKSKKAEEALQRASAYNRTLIEASLDPLVTIGPDGKITDVNEATIKVTAYLKKTSSEPTSQVTSQSRRKPGKDIRRYLLKDSSRTIR